MVESVLFLICFLGVPVLMAGSLVYLAVRALLEGRALRKVKALGIGREIDEEEVRRRLETLGLAARERVRLPVRLEIDSAIGPLWVVDYRQKGSNPDPSFRSARRLRLVIAERPADLVDFVAQRLRDSRLEKLLLKALAGHLVPSPAGWEWAILSTPGGAIAPEDLPVERGRALGELLREGELLRIGGQSLLLSLNARSMADLVAEAPARAEAVAAALA